MEDRVEILQANGLGLDDIFEVKVWLNHPRRDYRGFERAWRRWFPDPDKGPVVNVIPTTGIHFCTLIEIEFAALKANRKDGRI
jgi:enamine deaminase RidA (YjgF/YER057c/UK114 family)